MFGEVVDGIPHESFSLDDSAEQAREVYERHTGQGFPQDASEQLRRAVAAVFDSWNTPRAQVYRRENDIPDDLGTAVNVVQMVFGNKGERSAPASASRATRRRASRASTASSSSTRRARTSSPASARRSRSPSCEELMPEAYDQLLETRGSARGALPRHAGHRVHRRGRRLYLLQTRAAKRTAAAALKSAVDMVDEGLIDARRGRAADRPGQLDQLLHPRIDPTATRGRREGPRRVPRRRVRRDRLRRRQRRASAARRRGVILVRSETTPDDIHGLIPAQGILTAHGGMTSHAAVVARGMGKPCVAGCDGLDIDRREAAPHRRARAPRGRRDHDRRRHRPRVHRRGAARRAAAQRGPRDDPRLGGRDRRLRVRANADTPHDAVRAREFGAEGIGLCRTEHMFFGEERLPVVQEMILAADEEGRRERARAAAAVPAVRLRGDLRGDGRAAGDDPAARPAAARVPAAAGGGDGRADARSGSGRSPRRTRCSARAAAGSGSSARRSTRCRSVRSSAPRRPCRSAPGEAPPSRSCTRSSASRRSCAGCAS